MDSISAVNDSLATLLDRLQSIEQLRSIQDAQQLNKVLAQLLTILPGPITPEKLYRLDEDFYFDWRSFARNEYSVILEQVLNLFDADWPGDVDDAATKQVSQLFTIDHNYEFCAESLTALITNKNLGSHNIMLNILESQLRNGTFVFVLIVDLSYRNEGTLLGESNLRIRQQEAAQLLASIPNRVANKLKGKMPDIFSPETFGCVFSIALLNAIYFVSETNFYENDTIFETTFLSKLFSRLLIDFSVERTSKAIPIMFDVLSIWAQRNEKYRKTIQTTLLGLQRNAIEIAAMYLLQRNCAHCLLGDAVRASLDWRSCFLTKLPLMNYFNDENIVINLVRYLRQLDNIDEDLYQLFNNLVISWSSKISLAAHSIEQHLYITKLIVLCGNLFKNKFTEEQVVDFKRFMHKGVFHHIESLNETLRVMGMITAELVFNKFSAADTEQEAELRFDYAGFSEESRLIVEDLRKLNDLSIDAANTEILPSNDEDLLEKLRALSLSREEKSQPLISVQPSSPKLPQSAKSALEIGSISTAKLPMHRIANQLDEDDLDSDDDLEPYDMSNDTCTKAEKAPRYLIDLKEALLETDDPDVFEISLETCADLIREKLEKDSSRLGIELLGILISLEQKFYMENFDGFRFSGCVSICCVYPKESAEYLCRELHTEIGKYSIGKKVFMLDILSESAKYLSKITNEEKHTQLRALASTATESKAPKKLMDLSDNSKKRLDEAKQIIRARTESKTRRFATKASHPFVNAQKNRFAEVAGFFFFPLLHGFGKDQFTLVTSSRTQRNDTDNVLLVAFLNTVASLTIAAQNCPIAAKFAIEIFQLSSVLRFHDEPKIRVSVLKMIGATFLAAPKMALITSCYNEIVEIRMWLEQILSFNIVRAEKDTECREIANHVLALCLDVLN